jgi:hypothetical protein
VCERRRPRIGRGTANRSPPSCLRRRRRTSTRPGVGQVRARGLATDLRRRCVIRLDNLRSVSSPVVSTMASPSAGGILLGNHTWFVCASASHSEHPG